MSNKEIVAMLLAGGRGTRLKQLTDGIAKPAVHFGGKYRIIDFTLSNCSNSGIDTVGVLTQYEPLTLNAYIGNGSPWDLDRKDGGVYVLPPYVDSEGGNLWYEGTANAIYHNMKFIDEFDPEYLLVLSGDHVYKMDYSKMLDFHKKKNADATISVIPVPWEEASRFGIMNTDDDDKIIEFQEKPDEPKSNLASMGIYIFKWKTLKEIFETEHKEQSKNDFGKDILPLMLEENKQLYAYSFRGYWKDIGTVDSFWEANMDLLSEKTTLQLFDPAWHIYSRNPNMPVQFISSPTRIKNVLINEGCIIKGDVEHSVIYYGVSIGEGSKVKDSVILPGTKIGKNATITKAIIGEETIIEDGVNIGNENDITLIGNKEIISTRKNQQEVI